MHTEIRVTIGPTKDSAEATFATTDPDVVAAMLSAARDAVDQLEGRERSSHQVSLARVEGLYESPES